MTYQPIFDSRDARYKTPYGAVPTGTQVRLALRPPRSLGFSWARMTAQFESWGESRDIPMPWRGTELGADLYQTVLDTGDYVGLVWYSFVLEGLDGRKQELGPYQLTVYDGSEAVPAWF